MKVYDAASIRNVALVGHSGSGKTQLASAILFDAGMVNRLGRVDDGTTVTDFDDEEIARKHTLSASARLRRVEQAQDQPDRHARASRNFLSDARAALRVADAALVVVDAVSGVEVQTEKMWEAADELELPAPRRAEPARPRARQPRPHRSSRCARLRPDGHPDPAARSARRRHFTGVVDLVAMKAYTFAADGSGKMTEGADPGATSQPTAQGRARGAHRDGGRGRRQR